MEELKLCLIEGTLINEYELGEKIIYVFLTESKHYSIATIKNDIVYEFLNFRLGKTRTERIGKTINLICDDKKLISLCYNTKSYVLVKDYTDTYNKNVKYIQKRYGLNSKELRELIAAFIRSEINTKTLK